MELSSGQKDRGNDEGAEEGQETETKNERRDKQRKVGERRRGVGEATHQM